VNKLWTIFKHEYLSRVKTKGFILGTALTPILLILVSIAPGILINFQSEKIKHLSVIDCSGLVFSELMETVDDTTSTGKRLYELKQIHVIPEKLDSAKKELNIAVDNNRLDGYLIIPQNVLDENKMELYAKSISNFEENRKYRNAVERVLNNHRIRQSNLDPDLINDLFKNIKLETFKITSGGKEKADSEASFIITFILMMFLYVAILMYGIFVMRSIYEEKLSRVVEVVISSCKPFQLMSGKVLGIGAVGLTQYIIWAIAVGLLTFYGSSFVQIFSVDTADAQLPTIPLSILIYLVIFFVLGYLLYATIYAALGALVNSDQDAQQLQMPVMFFIVFAFIFSFYIIRNPNTILAVVISLIPFFSPITMFTRIAIQTPPIGEIILAIALLIATIILFIWLAGKIFRIGILMYGKRPTLPEIMKWIKY